MCTAHARDQIHYIEVATTKDGVITAIRDKMIADVGTYIPNSGGYSIVATASYVPGPYRVKNYQGHLYGVVTNKAPYGAYRGFGKADSGFIIERMMDIIATRLNLDPAELRFRNLVQPHEFPYTSVTGAIYDSGNFPECLRALLKAIDYENLRKEQKRNKDSNQLLGIGLAFMLEPVGAGVHNSLQSGFESSTIKIDPSGTVIVLTGLATQGQSHETTLAQIVADKLGIDIAKVSVVEGDTLTCPYGQGAFASRSAVAGALAVSTAADMIKDKMIRIAANLLEANPMDIILTDGRVQVKGTAASIDFDQIARLAYTQLDKLPHDLEPSLQASCTCGTPNIGYVPDEKGRINIYSCYTSGASASVVKVDKETGSVRLLRHVMTHDCGNMINPTIVEAQVAGGCAQGIGGAMLEEIVYDQNGQNLNNTFMDYLIPSAIELPNIELHHICNPTPLIPGGFKGCGESGTIGAAPSVVNAVRDALLQIGCEIGKTPVKSENVWAALRS
jgi:aerobic carbon-monoxide dehydrogenase large subunit